MESTQPRRYASELVLCDGVNDYHIFHPSVVPGPDDTPYTFQDVNEVEILLDRHMNRSVKAEFLLIKFLNTHEIPVLNRYSRRDRIQSLTRYILKRPVIITPHVPKEKGGGSGQKFSKKGSGFLAGYPHIDKQHIDFHFVDAKTGKAVSGVRARITHDDGSFQTMVSSRHGYMSREHLTPGSCSLYSDPTDILGLTVDNTVTTCSGKASRSLFDEEKNIKPAKRSYLSSVMEHKVQDNETLALIAESYGLSFNDLAQFNWGTAERKKVLAAMKRDTGCSRETETGDDCLFESKNDPGIIFIPKPFDQGGFKTGMEHTIKVSGTGFGAFWEPFEVMINNSKGDPVQGLECKLTHAHGTVSMVRTDRNGTISLNETNASKTRITVLGYDSFEIAKE